MTNDSTLIASLAKCSNDVDEDVDGCCDTKNTVVLVEQKSDSHVWICSGNLLAAAGCFGQFLLTDSQK